MVWCGLLFISFIYLLCKQSATFYAVVKFIKYENLALEVNMFLYKRLDGMGEIVIVKRESINEEIKHPAMTLSYSICDVAYILLYEVISIRRERERKVQGAQGKLSNAPPLQLPARYSLS